MEEAYSAVCDQDLLVVNVVAPPAPSVCLSASSATRGSSSSSESRSQGSHASSTGTWAKTAAAGGDDPCGSACSLAPPPKAPLGPKGCSKAGLATRTEGGGGDKLDLGGDKHFLKCIAAARCREDEATLAGLLAGLLTYKTETVQFSCVASKVRDTDGKSQKRVLVITNLAIYNFKPNKYKHFQRRMLLERLTSLLLSVDNATEFVIHFDCADEYDYTFHLSERREQASQVPHIMLSTS